MEKRNNSNANQQPAKGDRKDNRADPRRTQAPAPSSQPGQNRQPGDNRDPRRK